MPWSQTDKDLWFKEQSIKRSYKQEVVAKIEALKHFDVLQYGALDINPERYPLFLIKSQNFDQQKKTVLVTGGVHGYETSGVQGAIEFFKEAALPFTEKFNLVG